MSQSVERTSLDLRFQTHRLRNNATEARLLASIAERGIEQPLAGVDLPQGRLLLDGFKRLRCAKKLQIECLPYVSLGQEETLGIARLLRPDKNKALNILEQAKFVDELLALHEMSIADVAETLERSKSWVCMRRNLLKEISPTVQEILFRGDFPVYAYMYTLRPFMRMNGVTANDIDRFVQAISGQSLSHREIELLADGYFRGPESLRQEIDQKNWKWSLEQMQSVPADPEACNDVEQTLLADLEKVLKSMQRVISRCDDERLQTRTFHAQANLLVTRLLSKRESFFTQMEALLHRTGETS